jgi:RNA polymerase sigma-70 factor (ECF subfamily)
MVSGEADSGQGTLAALLGRLARGDEAALTALHGRYAALVHAMAARILGQGPAAEETTQDVFLRLWERPGAYDPARGAFSTWLLTVARHAAIDRLRLDGRQPPTSEPHRRADASSEDPLDRLAEMDRDEAESREQLRLLLANLPPEQREPLELAFYGGLSHQDIAECLALPLGTVKTRMRLGLAKLRAMYRDGA